MEDTLFSVKDKVIIVTGGLGQLGAQYVKTLHERGAKVAALATRVDAARVDRVLGAIKDSDRLLCAEVNITDKASINRVLDSIEAKWGVPDGWSTTRASTPSPARRRKSPGRLRSSRKRCSARWWK